MAIEILGYPSLTAYVEAMLAQGKTNREMADAAGLKNQTIQRVKRNLQYRSQKGGVR